MEQRHRAGGEEVCETRGRVSKFSQQTSVEMFMERCVESVAFALRSVSRQGAMLVRDPRRNASSGGHEPMSNRHRMVEGPMRSSCGTSCTKKVPRTSPSIIYKVPSITLITYGLMFSKQYAGDKIVVQQSSSPPPPLRPRPPRRKRRQRTRPLHLESP